MEVEQATALHVPPLEIYPQMRDMNKNEMDLLAKYALAWLHLPCSLWGENMIRRWRSIYISGMTIIGRQAMIYGWKTGLFLVAAKILYQKNWQKKTVPLHFRLTIAPIYDTVPMRWLALIYVVSWPVSSPYCSSWLNPAFCPKFWHSNMVSTFFSTSFFMLFICIHVVFFGSYFSSSWQKISMNFHDIFV